MPWNWQLDSWPNFRYDHNEIAKEERQFLLNAGSSSAFLKSTLSQDYSQFVVEILSAEGTKSSKIEGEMLNRESLQSSIKFHFGLRDKEEKKHLKESNMAKLLVSVYNSFEKPLTHQLLFDWHHTLFNKQPHISNVGTYRSHPEPMQIVSNRYDKVRVFFEAPPSKNVRKEMSKFIRWFNASDHDEPILGRAAIAHLYFESIHPFEDGNGRIGRALIEKVLSQGLNKPLLIAVSKILEKRRKEYYAHLGRCNKTLDVTPWVKFFAEVILQAQSDSMILLQFLVQKAKIFTTVGGQLNARQEKVLRRMFAVGPKGFIGGMSAEKYISITKTSRATATRDLTDLVEMKVLVKTGELRHTRYELNLNF